MNKKHFVTGGTGYLGSYLVERLRARGDQVELLKGDITEIETKHITSKVDFFWHLASNMDFRKTDNKAEARRFQVNVVGTIKAVALAKKMKAKFMHVSTAYVAGDAKEFSEYDLQEGQRFRNGYEKTKQEGERIVIGSDIPYVIFRPSLIVGRVSSSKTMGCVGGYYRWAYKYAEFAKNFNLKFMPIPNGCNLNIVSIEYVVAAMLKISGNSNAINKTFNLTHPTPIEVGYLAKCIAEDMGVGKVNIIRINRSLYINAAKILSFFLSFKDRVYVNHAWYLIPYWTGQTKFIRTNADLYNDPPKEIDRAYIKRIHMQVLRSVR